MIDTPDRFGTELRQLAATAALSPTGGDLLRPEPHHYRLIEKPERVYAVDRDDIEICGARRPYGHETWVIYITSRVTGEHHHVLAQSRDTAVAHVKLIAGLFCEKAA